MGERHSTDGVRRTITRGTSAEPTRDPVAAALHCAGGASALNPLPAPQRLVRRRNVPAR